LGGGKTGGLKAESLGGVLERGSNPIPTSYGVWASTVSSLSGVWGGALTARRFPLFSVVSMASPDYNIVNCGLSCTAGIGARPP